MFQALVLTWTTSETQLQDVNKHCNIGWLLYCTNDDDDDDDYDDDIADDDDNDNNNNNKNGIVQNV